MKTRLLLLICLAPLLSTGQIVISPDAVLSITPTATFYAGGDFINNGQVLNNGSLNISGAWTNNGDYEAESGQVDFNGAGDQIINHNSQSFAKLVLSGGGKKIFKADITIQQVLSLQSGILATDNSSKIILAETATVTGGSSASFIQGPVYATGTGSRLYPVGINATYLPVTLTSVAGTSPVVGIEVVEPNTNSEKNDPLVSVSALRYWKVTTLSGTFTGSPATVTLANESFTKSDNIVVAQAASESAPFLNLGRSAFTGSETSGTVTSKDLVTASIITVAEIEDDLGKDITVYNAVTPNGDGMHDFLKIVNITSFPENEVVIVNRWGDKVYSVTGYDNSTRKFDGDGNTGGAKSLADGTYYYIIDKHDGEKKITGFLILKR